MKNFLRSILLLLTLSFHTYAQAVRDSSIAPTAALNNPARQKQFTHPLCITENKGQITDQYGHPRADIQYKTGSGYMSVFIGNGALHYQFRKPDDTSCPKTNMKTPQKIKTTGDCYQMYRLDMTLIGANPHAQVIAADKQSYYENYYTTALHTGDNAVSAYNRITYKNIYPGIDWALYIKDNKLEYDFIINPGGNVNDIKIKYNGATGIAHSKGNIKINTPLGDISESNLYAYEQATRKPVATHFKFKNNILGFSLKNRSRVRNIIPPMAGPGEATIIIDPTLVWGTYYGGSGSDQGYAIACDSVGNIYITGSTTSAANIATTGAYQTTYRGGYDAFLAAFSNNGAILWATYYGGNAFDQGYGICSDHAGNIYIAGYTSSTNNIATPGAYQTIYGGGEDDAFLAKFSSSGLLLWATYYGGDSTDIATPVTSDGFNNVYMEGVTNSLSGIATTGAYQSNYAGGGDAFLVKFDSAGHRQWGTYFGGSSIDGPGYYITWDGNRSIYITGMTESIDGIAAPGAYQTSLNGSYDAFLTKFRTDGSLAWSTYYGGEGEDGGTSVAVDHTGNVFLCGGTASYTGIATMGAYQGSYGGDNDAFLVKFDSTGARQWGTYYGGSNYDEAFNIACDPWDNIFIGGATFSINGISTAGAYQDTFMGTSCAFLANFNESGESLLWGTYYGGNGYTKSFGMIANGSGNIYMTGVTSAANNMATPGTYQTIIGGGVDAFVAKFGSFTTGIANTIPVIENVSLYPNPNNGNFTVSGTFNNFYTASGTIDVIDEKGEIIYSSQETINGNILDKKISLPALIPGIYTLCLSAGNQIKTILFSVSK